MYELKLYGYHKGEFECHSCVDLSSVSKAFFNFVNQFGLHHFKLKKKSMNLIKKIILRIKFKRTGINLNDLHKMIEITKLMEKRNINENILNVNDLRNFKCDK